MFVGDARLPERLRAPELLSLGSRIRRRLTFDCAACAELLACLDHLLESAGNPALTVSELKAKLADHAAGNHRVVINLCDDLSSIAQDRELPRLDRKLYLDAYTQPQARNDDEPSPLGDPPDQLDENHELAVPYALTPT